MVTPERRFANDLREMFNRATRAGSSGTPLVEVIRAIVEAAECLADARDLEHDGDQLLTRAEAYEHLGHT